MFWAQGSWRQSCTTHMGGWAWKPVLEQRLAGAMWADCTGKRGEWKGLWSRLLILKGFIGDFSPPKSAEMNGHWPGSVHKAGTVHSRERKIRSQNSETLTASLGSKFSLLSSFVASPKNVLATYLHVTDLFSRCCWAVSISSLRRWIICILMTFEMIAFLPLLLNWTVTA